MRNQKAERINSATIIEIFCLIKENNADSCAVQILEREWIALVRHSLSIQHDNCSCFSNPAVTRAG